MPPPKVQAKFIDPMLLLRTEKLPEGDAWLYEPSPIYRFWALALAMRGRLGSASWQL
jgi:hypothetical protein